MERVIAIIFLLVIAIGGYSMWWQAFNCTTEFTEHGHPISVCEPMEDRDR